MPSAAWQTPSIVSSTSTRLPTDGIRRPSGAASSRRYTDPAHRSWRADLKVIGTDWQPVVAAAQSAERLRRDAEADQPYRAVTKKGVEAGLVRRAEAIIVVRRVLAIRRRRVEAPADRIPIVPIEVAVVLVPLGRVAELRHVDIALADQERV